MTDLEKQSLWESLHECYSISTIAAHSLNYQDKIISASAYATLLERSAKLLLQAIATVDKIPNEAESRP